MDQETNKMQKVDKELVVTERKSTPGEMSATVRQIDNSTKREFKFAVIGDDAYRNQNSFTCFSHLIHGSPPFRNKDESLVLKNATPYWTKNSTMIEDMGCGDVKDCILIYHSDSQTKTKTLGLVLEFAAWRGAEAVVCDFDPKLEKYPIPTFFIETSTIRKVNRLTSNALVFITAHHKEDFNQKQTNSDSPGQMEYDIVERGSFEEGKKHFASPRNDVRKDEIVRSSSKQKSGNWFTNVIEVVTSTKDVVVNVSVDLLGGNKVLRLLGSESGWDEKSAFCKYKEAFHEIDMMVDFDDTKVKAKVAGSALDFIRKRTGCNLYHLSVMARICVCLVDEENDLSHEVFLHLIAKECQYTVTLKNMKWNKWWGPSPVDEIYGFLTRRVLFFNNYLQQNEILESFLVLLVACGFLKRKFSQTLWHQMREKIDWANVAQVEMSIVKRCNRAVGRSIVLYFATNLGMMTAFIDDGVAKKRAQQQDPNLLVPNIVAPLIISLFQDQICCKEENSIINALFCVCKLLDHIRFHHRSEQSLLANIAKTVFRDVIQTEDFELIIKSRTLVSDIHYAAEILLSTHQQCLCGYIRDHGLSCEDARLFLSNAFGVWSNKTKVVELLEAIVEFSLPKWTLFNDKVQCLGRISSVLHENIPVLEGHLNVFLMNALRQAIVHENVPREVWLSMFLEVAADDCSLFVSPDGNLCKLVATVIFDKSTFHYLIQNFEKFCCLKFPYMTENINELQLCILLRIKDLSKEHFDGIVCASNAIVHINAIYQGCSSFLHDCVSGNFVDLFQQWNPTMFDDFCDNDLVIAEALLSLYFHLLHKDTPANDIHDRIEPCISCAERLISEFIGLFDSDELSKLHLKKVENRIDLCTLRKLANIFDKELPTKQGVEKKLQDFDELEASFKSNFHITVDNKVVDVPFLLNEMQCFPNATDDISVIIEVHKCLLQLSSQSNKAMTLSVLRNAAATASEFMEENRDLLQICSYFHFNPSVIFQTEVYSASSSFDTYLTMLNAVQGALLVIKNAFGTDSTYQGACRVLDSLTACSVPYILEHECSNLLLCPHLNVCVHDVESFNNMAAISALKKPLKHFIWFCKRFAFAISSMDPTFEQLQNQTATFYGNSSTDVDSKSKCLDFLVLVKSCFGLHENVHSLLTLLHMLSYIAVHPDVWDFVEEMGWFGEIGIKRFYSEHSNVTNVLLGCSASYEMSILDSLEPTVRLISTMEGYKSVKPLKTFIFKSLQDEYVQTALNKLNMEKEVQQVHSRLSEIKDWFRNGVDEVGSTRDMFDCVWGTGSYRIVESQFSIDYRNQFSLQLNYIVDNCGQREERSLSGSDINIFMQQISQIQVESPTFTKNVVDCVDQYHIVAKAAKNFQDMSCVGYDKMAVDDFFCLVNADGLESSQDLLQMTIEQINSFESWLLGIQEAYQVSLLFWREEMWHLYELLSNSSILLDMCLARCQKVFQANGISTVNVEQEKKFGEIVIDSNMEILNQTTSWFIQTSSFLNKLVAGIDVKTLTTTTTSSFVKLHIMLTEDSKQSSSILSILANIYKDRLPLSFEMLHGAFFPSADFMDLFLQRIKHFPNHTFAIIGTDCLEAKSLEKLFLFLTSKSIVSAGIKLHVLFNTDSVAPSAPWIVQQTWGKDAIENFHSSLQGEIWRNLIVDKASIVSALVVVSPSTGSGKTRYIRGEMEKIVVSGQNVQTGSVVIHEGSTFSSLVTDLTKKFDGKSPGHALHISFQFLPVDLNQHQQWLIDVNHFFFSFLILQELYDPETFRSFSPLKGEWRLFVELPYLSSISPSEWIRMNVAPLHLCASVVEPPNEYNFDEAARQVCKYLRAYSTGTIDRKFGGCNERKRLMLVMDQSGSMNAILDGGISSFQASINNALEVFDSCIGENDEFGVLLFDHHFDWRIPIQIVGKDPSLLRRSIQNLIPDGGGTSIYGALQHGLQSILSMDQSVESWIVCLTDGASADNDTTFRPMLVAAPDIYHLIVIGVNLDSSLERFIEQMCNRYVPTESVENKGFFVRSNASVSGITDAFQAVMRAIPVSRTFDFDGKLTDDDCHFYSSKYMPAGIVRTDMTKQSFWFCFLYRRVKVFDSNDSFNYNEKHENLGSTLMRVMLSEVERLLCQDQSSNWIEENYSQLIYDFTNNGKPEFRILCTAPETMNNARMRKLMDLDLPGFSIPTKALLESRTTLDRYLGQALGISLTARDDEPSFLKCIDDNNFVLTLDFTIKLLLIHERVECRTPCILEGETGVSKTALTKMYSILRNCALSEKTEKWKESAYEEVIQDLKDLGYDIPEENENDSFQRLKMFDFDQDHECLQSAKVSLQRVMQQIPPVLETGVNSTLTDNTAVLLFIDQLNQSKHVQTFFDIKVDSSLNEQNFIDAFNEVQASANKLESTGALVIVFLDEINTSKVIGLLKEVVVDHSLAGVLLPDNIVVIAACNPARHHIHKSGTRERDLGKDWASGHYQVVSLPPSMDKMKWSLGSLRPEQEKEFIYRRLGTFDCQSIPTWLIVSLTEIIAASHDAIRHFAFLNIMDSLNSSISSDEAQHRARSIVSLRDIQRIFSLYHFMYKDFKLDLLHSYKTDSTRHRYAMLIAIGVVYYIRLDSKCRDKFVALLSNLQTETQQTESFLEIFENAVDLVLSETEIPIGIASTRGLRENIFVALVCTMSKTPLMIIGPPGSSKVRNLILSYQYSTRSSYISFVL